MSYKLHVVSDYRKIDSWHICNKYHDALAFMREAKEQFIQRLDPTEGMNLDLFERLPPCYIKLVKSERVEPKDKQSERKTCRNCRLYWGCRMSDNPQLDDDEEGRPCTRWSAK